MTTNLSETPGNTTNRHHNGSRRIRHLLQACFPSAIIGFIITVIVLSADGKTYWLFPHISQKVLELQPSFANLDAATPVSAESGFCRIIAPTNHGPPRMISRAVFPANITSMAMRYVSSSHGLQFQAATRPSCSIAKRVLSYPKPSFATGTIAKYTGQNFASGTYFVGCIRNYFKSSKSLPDDIYSGGHNIAQFSVVCSGGRSARTDARCDLKDVGFTLT